MINAPNIKPIKVKEFETKQSKYPHCGKLPIRSVILGPSGSGKTVLLSNMILDIYKGCFSRVYIFSPSIEVDYTWIPVKGYIEKEMNKCYFQSIFHTDLGLGRFPLNFVKM